MTWQHLRALKCRTCPPTQGRWSPFKWMKQRCVGFDICAGTAVKAVIFLKKQNKKNLTGHSKKVNMAFIKVYALTHFSNRTGCVCVYVGRGGSLFLLSWARKEDTDLSALCESFTQRRLLFSVRLSPPASCVSSLSNPVWMRQMTWL